MAENHLWPLFPLLFKVCIRECHKLTSMPLFPPLENLELYYCSFKPMGQKTRIAKVASSLYQWPSLTVLELVSLPVLEYVFNSEEFFNSSVFPSLEEVKLKYCPNLKGWWPKRRDSVEEVDNDDDDDYVENHSLPSFPHLSNLSIEYCPKLTFMLLFPYLEKLLLKECILKPLEKRMSMGIIKMATPGNLTSTAAASTSSSTFSASSFVPFSKLEFLNIEAMKEPLPKELRWNLISLNDLTICNCRGPLPVPRHLIASKDMTTMGSEEVDLWDEMEWQVLGTLRFLQLRNLPKLVSLLVGLQHVTSQQALLIWDCQSLMAKPEWICNLTSLQLLYIWDCPKLNSLPYAWPYLFAKTGN